MAPVGPPKQQAVLAALLLDAGQALPMDELIDRVWDGVPPAKARTSVYSYITGLRRTMTKAFGHGQEPLTRAGGGYRLDVDRQQVDVHRFVWLASERPPTESALDRVRRLGTCLDLWRGRPLGGLDGDWAGQVRAWLENHYVQVVVDLATAQIGLGRAHDATQLLYRARLTQPLSEPLAATLMRAHLAAGQRPEALATFTATRRRLVRDLGVEPSSDLRLLHQAALTATTAVVKSR